MSCQTYWGSHGCDFPTGHPGTIHRCGGTDWDAEWDSSDAPCSEFDEGTGLARHADIDRPIWWDWSDCCPMYR